MGDIAANRIICGDALSVLKGFPDESINCCISSPPYWALRDYGVEGQLGLEKTFEAYIDRLCGVYDEVWRVLRADGTCWVNLGDTYYGGNKGTGGCDPVISAKQLTNQGSWMDGRQFQNDELPAKSLCLIPDRFRIECVNRGWIIRNKIVWHKPNPMPSSAKDRFTVDFEDVIFMVKSRKYWFEQQYEPYAPNSDMEYRKTLRLGKFYRAGNQNPYKDNTPLAGDREMTPLAAGKNSCPELVCKKCGKAREKIYEKDSSKPTYRQWLKTQENKGKLAGLRADGLGQGILQRYYDEVHNGKVPPKNFKNYTDCGCNAGFRPGIVLDPFCGTGTALAVAASLGRDYIGIDISQEYVDKFAIPKTQAVETGVPVAEQKAGQGALFE